MHQFRQPRQNCAQRRVPHDEYPRHTKPKTEGEPSLSHTEVMHDVTLLSTQPHLILQYTTYLFPSREKQSNNVPSDKTPKPQPS